MTIVRKLVVQGRAIPRDWGTALIVVFGIYVSAYIAWLMIPWGAPEQRILINDLVFVPPSFMAACLAWRIVACRSCDAMNRRAWAWLALALVANGIGEALWFHYEIIRGVAPYPSAADVGYLAFYPLVLGGILSFPMARHAGIERAKFWLDTATVFVGGGLVLWHLVLRPVAWLEHSGSLPAALSLAYPLGDLALLFGVATLLLRSSDAHTRATLNILAAAILLILIADVGYAYLSLQATYQSTDWPDLFWITGKFLFGLSAYHRYLRPGQDSADRSTPNRSWTFHLLPYLAVLLGYGQLLIVAGRAWVEPFSSLSIGVTVLTGIVLTRQALADRAVRRSEARYRSLLHGSSDMTTLLNEDGSILYQTAGIADMLGYAPDEVIGHRSLEWVHPDDVESMRVLFHRLREQPEHVAAIEHRLRRRDGSWLHVESLARNLSDHPHVRGFVITTRDISERKQIEHRLIQRALHDPLTGLPNRALLMQELERALRQRHESVGLTAVLFIDLDGFKSVNDSLGHAAGDQLLIAVARRIQSCLRAHDLVARLGGDEFAVLIRSVGHLHQVTPIAKRIVARLAEGYRLDHGEISSVTASVGIALASTPAISAADVLQQADRAMYAAKGAGKARYAVYLADDEQPVLP